jgi:hypothetical protein
MIREEKLMKQYEKPLVRVYELQQVRMLANSDPEPTPWNQPGAPGQF